MAGRINKGNHYTLLYIKYKSPGLCGFIEEDFFFPYCKSIEANDSQGRAIFYPRGIIGRIYVGYH